MKFYIILLLYLNITINSFCSGRDKTKYESFMDLTKDYLLTKQDSLRCDHPFKQEKIDNFFELVQEINEAKDRLSKLKSNIDRLNKKQKNLELSTDLFSPAELRAVQLNYHISSSLYYLILSIELPLIIEEIFYFMKIFDSTIIDNIHLLCQIECKKIILLCMSITVFLLRLFKNHYNSVATLNNNQNLINNIENQLNSNNELQKKSQELEEKEKQLNNIYNILLTRDSKEFIMQMINILKNETINYLDSIKSTEIYDKYKKQNDLIVLYTILKDIFSKNKDLIEEIKYDFKIREHISYYPYEKSNLVGERAENIVKRIVDEYTKDRHNRQGCQNYLLYGPPGTGKTSILEDLMAKLARESGNNTENGIVFRIDTNSMQNSQDLNTLKFQINKLIEGKKIGKQLNIMIFIDEMDGLFVNRDDCLDRNDFKMVTEMTQFIDYYKKRDEVYIFATTNYIKKIDPAILREGRFNKQEILLPNFSERKLLVKNVFFNKEVSFTEWKQYILINRNDIFNYIYNSDPNSDLRRRRDKININEIVFKLITNYGECIHALISLIMVDCTPADIISTSSEIYKKILLKEEDVYSETDYKELIKNEEKCSEYLYEKLYERPLAFLKNQFINSLEKNKFFQALEEKGKPLKKSPEELKNFLTKKAEKADLKFPLRIKAIEAPFCNEKYFFKEDLAEVLK